jgi:DNA repair protein SbcC/Rad50
VELPPPRCAGKQYRIYSDNALHPAFNVVRVRNLVPDYRRLESLRASLHEDVSRTDRAIADTQRVASDRLAQLNRTLAEHSGNAAMIVSEETDLVQIKRRLGTGRDEENRLTELSRVRSELKGSAERWQSLPTGDATHDQAGKERRERAASQALIAWRSSPGNDLESTIGIVRARFSELPSLDDGPEKSRVEALRRAQAEESRCGQVVTANTAAAERINRLNAVVQRATTRIEELTKDLAAGVDDAKSLANALAGVAPHVESGVCPVCNRDFAEVSSEPLSTHIAAKIAALTSEAGRLQALATERAEESTRLSTARRDLLGAAEGQLRAEEVADLTVRRAQMADAVQRLETFHEIAEEGARLMADAARARDELLLSRRRDELSTSLLPDIHALVQSVVQRPASSFADINDALQEADRIVERRTAEVERLVLLRIRAVSELDMRIRDLAQIEMLKATRTQVSTQLATIDKAAKQVEVCRGSAKKIADSADKVRANIVKTVFNTSLNKTWRDLFVRLAPSEQFVPAFRLPAGDGGKVEAVLETLHRSGKVSGSPSAMLSQGNLNTAALTLFLALHLSVPVRMPWLILDDPVQSMDDVHVAQFAALLRSLSKGTNRQIVIAVHERTLFDYLTLELGPAFPGDSLIAVEITRNFEGEAVAMPRALSFEEDRAIAA